MKKIIMMLISLMILITGCSQTPSNCGDYESGESWMEDCNTCNCIDGKISCTKMACFDEKQTEPENDSSFIDEFKETLDLVKFNSDLTEYEEKYLKYFEEKYPNTRIYHIKTSPINCENCYELYYKKDREILKVKVLDGEIKQQTRITEDLFVEIENEDVCKLFQGNWNTCPKICPTDEEICVTQCGEPVCEFEKDKIILKKEGEICGGLDEGDCEYGFTCLYENSESQYGICQLK